MLHHQNHFLHSCCCEDEGKNFIVTKFYCKVRHNKQTMYYILGYSILKWYIASLLDIPILFQECPHNDIHYCCIASFLTKISILAFNTSYEQLAMFPTPRSGPTPRRRLLCPGWLGGSSSNTFARRFVEFRSPVRSTICFIKMRRASCTECFSSNCWTLDPNWCPDKTWNLSQKS